MAISRTHSKKQPSQSPVDFYKLKQSGGRDGAASGSVPDKLTGGPQRENVYGKKSMK